MTPVQTESPSLSYLPSFHSSLNVEAKKKKNRMRKKEKRAEQQQQQQQIDENESNTATQSIDQQLSKSRDLDAFFLRRVEFVKYTRPDARQDALRKKYKPINATNTTTTTTTTITARSIHSNNIAKIDSATGNHNQHAADETSSIDPASQLDLGEALVLPKRGIFPENRLSLSWRNVQSIGPGLLNLGNTCFLNSVLQCLTYTPSLAQYILESGHGRTCRIPGFCMLCELEVHVKQCLRREGGGHHAVRPGRIVGRLRAIAKHMRLGRQEDAHEFLRYLVDAMQTSCLADYESNIDARLKETTLVYRVFGGYLRSQVRCLSCGHRSNTYDPLLDLSIDLAGVDSVEKALNRFTRPEKLTRENRYRCDACRQLVEARKRFTIERAPDTLTLHLKRFDHYGEKIGKHIDFDETLDLTSCLSSHVDIRDAERAGKSIHSLMVEPAQYKLYAVLVHAGGSCRSGHYYSYVKSAAGMWYCMNDESVDQVSAKRVLNEKAYILFYTRQPVSMSTKNNIAKPVKQSSNNLHATAIATASKQKPVLASTTKTASSTIDLMDLGETVDRTKFTKKTPENQALSSSSSSSSISVNDEKSSHKLSKKEKKRLRRLKKRQEAEAEEAAAQRQSTASTDYTMITDSDVDTLRKQEPVTPSNHQPLSNPLAQIASTSSIKRIIPSVIVNKSSNNSDTSHLANTPAPVIQWDENEDAKSAKLDAVIQRETARKSQVTNNATTLEAMFGARDRQSQYDGAQVHAWDITSTTNNDDDDDGVNAVTRETRDQLVKSMIKKKKRPSTYDLEYDRPKERKRKRDGAGAQAIWHVQQRHQQSGMSNSGSSSTNIFQNKMEELHRHGVPRSLQKSKSGKKRRPHQY